MQAPAGPDGEPELVSHRATARAAAEADPVFRRLWEQGAREELPRAVVWLEREGPAITARLTGTRAAPA